MRQSLVGSYEVDEGEGVRLPMLDIYQGFRKWQSRYALHFVSEGFHHGCKENTRYVYWFNVPCEEWHFERWYGWDDVKVTFVPTAGLMSSLWKEGFDLSYSGGNTETLPKRKPGYNLTDLTSDISGAMRLSLYGIRFDISLYERVGQKRSFENRATEAFISGVQLPDSEYSWDLSTMESVFACLNRIREVKKELQTSVRNSLVVVEPTGNGEGEYTQFLAELKSKCYAIKGSQGNEAAKAAFEIYKEVARQLSQRQALRSSS